MSEVTSPSPCLSWIACAAAHLRARTGWRRAGAAFAFGFISALAFAPTNFVPVLWFCFPALIFLIQGTGNFRQAFITGWCFAFGQFVLGLYWIAASMFVDIKQFWWGVPLAVAGLPAFLAIYYGLVGTLVFALRRLKLSPLSSAIATALLWFLADYVRGHLFTGFPWNLEGYAWGEVLPILQITSVTGIYGLTLLTLVACCIPACLAEDTKHHRRAVIGSFILIMLLAAWGQGRLMQNTGIVPDVRLRLVQPNVDQAHKWIADQRETHFDDLLAMTAAPPQAGEHPVTHVIWPETAATFYLTEDAWHRKELAERVPAEGAVLTGVLRRDKTPDGVVHYYNSLISVDGFGRVTAGYDKAHLVPYGEYIPLRHMIPIPALVNLGMDFSSGDGAHTIRVQGLPVFSPMICYEVIFPGDIVDPNDRPQFLLNVTNDGWYGNTAGPYQHFSIASVRAIEEGMPLVRAANTGISGVIDAFGRVTAEIPLGQKGTVDADLPQAIDPTLFSRYGEGPLWLLVGIFTVSVVLGRFLTMKV